MCTTLHSRQALPLKNSFYLSLDHSRPLACPPCLVVHAVQPRHLAQLRGQAALHVTGGGGGADGGVAAARGAARLHRVLHRGADVPGNKEFGAQKLAHTRGAAWGMKCLGLPTKCIAAMAGLGPGGWLARRQAAGLPPAAPLPGG